MRPDVLNRLVKHMQDHGFKPKVKDTAKFVANKRIWFDTGLSKKADASGLIHFTEIENGIRGYYAHLKTQNGRDAKRYVPFFIPFDPNEETASRRRPPDDPERRARDADLARIRDEAEQENRTRAADNAAKLWEISETVDGNPYLEKKGVLSLLRPDAILAQVASDKVQSITGYAPRRGDELLSGNLLMVPLSDASGAFVNVELIDPTSIKVGLYGGQRRGAFWVTRPIADGMRIGIAEGVATSITISAALDIPVVAVGGCHNFAPVLDALKVSLPNATFVVFPDLGGGQKFAVEAAAGGGHAVVSPSDHITQKGGNDFNDFLQQDGLDAVKDFLGQALGEALDDHALPGLPPGIRNIDFSRVTQRPVMDYVIPGLRAGNVGMLVGPGGVGKSFVTLQLGMWIATGKLPPWIVEPPEGFAAKAGRVGLLFGEDDADSIKDRVFSVKSIRRDGWDWNSERNAQLLSKNLRTYPLVGHDMRIAVQDRYEIHDGAFMKNLETFCSGKRLVVIDPLARLLDGDENDNRVAGAMMSRLVGIASRTRCAILLLHHMSKGGSGKAGTDGDDWASARGASALTTSVRFQLNLRKVNLDEYNKLETFGGSFDENQGRFVVLTATKVNHGPMPERAFMERSTGGVLVPAPLKEGAKAPPPQRDAPRKKPAVFGDLEVDD